MAMVTYTPISFYLECRLDDLLDYVKFVTKKIGCEIRSLFEKF